MAESLPVPVAGRWRPAARFVFRTGRRAIVESLYLLTAPAIAAASLMLVLGGLFVAPAGLLRPGKPRPAAGRGRPRSPRPTPGCGSTWRTRWWCSPSS